MKFIFVGLEKGSTELSKLRVSNLMACIFIWSNPQQIRVFKGCTAEWKCVVCSRAFSWLPHVCSCMPGSLIKGSHPDFHQNGSTVDENCMQISIRRNFKMYIMYNVEYTVDIMYNIYIYIYKYIHIIYNHIYIHLKNFWPISNKQEA